MILSMLKRLDRNVRQCRFLRRFSAFYLIFLLFLSLFCPIGAAAAGPEPEMALIPGGDFFMGSPESSGFTRPEWPRHKVSLDPFLMDKYEVSNEQFAAFLNAMADKKAAFTRGKWIVIRDDLAIPGKEDWWPTEIVYDSVMFKAAAGFEKYPVLSVSWFAADAYCLWRGARLPTEAEWEKAARGGLSDKSFPWGDELPTHGIVFRNPWRNNYYAAPVERINSYLPNGYGLYQMAGNVAEWCSDWYSDNYYQGSPGKNPKGPESGVTKVVRGGSWASDVTAIRVAFRNFSQPHFLNSGVGFRCAKDAGTP